MRTTVRIDDDVHAAAAALADAERISLGQALSRLARRGLGHHSAVDSSADIPAFRVRPGARALTAEAVARGLED